MAKAINKAKKGQSQLANQQKLIDKFKELKQSIGTSNEALTQAQYKAQQLAKQLHSTINPTKKQIKEFEKARKEVKKLSEAYNNQHSKLNEARLRLQESKLRNLIQVDNRPPIASQALHAKPSSAIHQNIQITINPSPNHSEAEIARQVQKALEQAERKAKARNRSSLRDRG